MDATKRVVVIGAGAAGVTAARELRRGGYETLMLEARRRVGGRTFHDDGFELGGAYIHPSQPHLWAEVTRYGLSVVRRDDTEIECVILLSEGRRHELDVEAAYALIGEAYAAFYAAAPHPSHVFPQPYGLPDAVAIESFGHLSAAEVTGHVALPPLQRDLLNGLLSTDVSARLSDVALVELLRLRALLGTDDFARVAEVSGTYVLEAGTSALISAMLADADAELMTGKVVTAIEQQDDSVRVLTHQNDSYAADAVVLATPLNTWSHITLNPALDPSVLGLAQTGHAGRGLKLFVQVKEALPGTLAIAPESHGLTMLTTAGQDEQGTWLIGFGADAAALDITSQAAVADAVRAFLPDVTVTRVRAHDWTNDSFARGTWCSLRPGQWQGQAVAKQAHGRVVFASADIALGWRGFIDGAIESGLRAARQVKAMLG